MLSQDKVTLIVSRDLLDNKNLFNAMKECIPEIYVDDNIAYINIMGKKHFHKQSTSVADRPTCKHTGISGRFKTHHPTAIFRMKDGKHYIFKSVDDGVTKWEDASMVVDIIGESEGWDKKVEKAVKSLHVKYMDRFSVKID